MKTWQKVALGTLGFVVGVLVAYNFVARSDKGRSQSTTPTISSKPMYEFPNNGGL